MTEIQENRQNLYKNLISDGYFRDENGEINFSFEDFNEGLNDIDNAKTFYANMVDDGYFRDEGGELSLSEEDFLTMIGSGRQKLEYYPLTENQRGVYIDWEMNREALQYNIPSVKRIKHVNAQALKDALVQVVNAHPYIKTRFSVKDGDIVQLRRDDDAAEVSLTKLDSVPDTAFFQQRVRPFNLLGDQLYRLEVYEAPDATYLFKDLHHSISDGFSDVLFMNDLKTILSGGSVSAEDYTAFDFALDEQQLLSGDARDEAEQYFDGLLEGASPTIYPHSTEGTTDATYGSIEMKIPSVAINELCRQNGCTSNHYFLTILTQTLHRITREDTVLISTINNGRNAPNLLSIMGMFVKTLPVVSTLVTDEARKKTITGQMKDVQRQLNTTEGYMYYPFTSMVERHHINPQILYVYHGRIDADTNDKGIEDINLSLDTVKMPITVTIYQKGDDDYTLLLIYNPSLYSESDIKRFGSALTNASLNGLHNNTIAELSLLGDEDKKQLSLFHSTCKQDIPWKLYYQPIEENAVKYADRVALIAKDRTLTFAEFNTEANRIAHALIRKGVKRGDRVVLLLPRRSCAIISMFGVSKTGAAYIPCDPEYPADRINLIMTDSEAQYVITTTDHAADYPAEKVILIDDIYNTGKELAGDDENPNVNVSPEDLAYLIYTSGSTGRPKGVMLRHIGIANYLYPHPANIHIQGLIDLGVKSFVSITTLSFDMSLKEFAGSLFNGITSILADEEEVMDAQLLANLMKRTGAEAINGTCSRILTYLELDSFREALSHCKTVWSGGEKYPMQLLTQLQALGLHIFNTYGPTEITVSSNIADLTKSRKVTVGHPLLNYEEYIVDQFDNELPIGFTGELLIGGPGVAVGYNNLPEMTAERFIQYNGIRVYRSGDLARWEADGDVEIIGRNDGQVKLRGFRVELGEIEGVASKFPNIKQAVADIKEVGTVQHLCLYYTADAEIDEEALKSFLAESLTEYMVPTAYIHINAIPLTPNGKTNRKALPIPKIKVGEIVSPENETEETILSMMKQQLKTDDLGVTTNLVSIGLSSIAAMRLSAVLLQQHGIKILVKDILEHPTVREMARMSTSDEKIIYKPYELRKTYPLSETQRGMLVDCLINKDALQYNIPTLLKYKTVNVQKLKQALAAIGDAHPYLKARIAMEGEDYVQVRCDEEQLEIEEYTLDFEPDRAYFQKLVRPFDVLNEKLYRFKLYNTPSYYYLFIDIHHLISDGSSNYVLARDMEKAYAGLQLVKEQYTAFDRAIDEEIIMKTERGTEAEAYFDGLLTGMEATIYPHSAEIDGNGIYGVLEETIPSKDINDFCKANALAPSSFFLTVFHNVLHRITRDESTLVYFISNGRSEVQLENFFGVFVKTMPTVVSNYDCDIVSSVKQMHQQMLDTIAHDFYPFTRMTERYSLKAEILYNYFVDLQTNMTLDSDSMETIGLDWDTAKTPLSITMLTDDNGNYVSSLEYDSRLYNERDMRILNKAFKAFAENCIVPHVSLNRFAIISDADALSIKALSHGKSMDYDMTQTFPAIFMQRAIETPDAPAVVDERGTYTYRELNRLSGALAMELRHLGVGSVNAPSPFVSIMLGYQKEFLVASIGIEKAGGAYVPLDYDYPNDRLLYMLEDSESLVLITSHSIYEEKTANGDKFTAKNILFIEDFLMEKLGMEDYSMVNYATPDDLAYMIYTSGSTGKPKGVMIPHRAKMNFVNFIAKEWGHTSKSRICCHSSFSFDASVEDLYPVLTVGGTLYTVPQNARKDMDLLHDFIVKNGITGGCYTTQLGQMLLQMYPDLPVDYLVVGGEKMTTAPDCKCRLINTYGPTEFTVDATFYDVVPGKEYKNIPIGHALHNLAAYVVDPVGQLLPQGIAGELCMAGVQMATGYWKREDLTKEKFADCPFAEGKMYHTGDLVRYNADGEIEYLGRIDSQVKLRGFRIELGEIETLIAGYDGIKMVSVQVREVGGVQHLCAYYSADREIDADVLRDYLAEQLTDYMVPTAYMQLDEMPLTPNGKVNTKALPMPEVKAEEIVAPETELEKQLYDIVAELLKHNQFGVTSNLLSMGLTSLSSMRLSAKIREATGLKISTRVILHTPTIREMIASLNAQDEQPQQLEKIHMARRFYPLTENQKGIYIDWEMNRLALQYNIVDVRNVSGVDVDQLRNALITIIEAHPYLKTRIDMCEGEVVQVRRDEAEPVVSIIDMPKGLDGQQTAAWFQSRVRPFDLYNDDLYRMEIHVGDDKTWLFIDIHHIIFDGGSSFILFNELQSLLAGKTIEKETYTAFDRALDEQEMRESPSYDKFEYYFDSLMKDYEVATYPHSYTADSKTPKAKRLDIEIEKEAIRDYCHRINVTENSFFMAAFGQVMNRLTRQKRIFFTSISNGRMTDSMQQIFGMFVQTLPVIVELSDSTFDEAVKLMHKQYLDTQDYALFPYTRIVEKYGCHSEVMFAYEGGLDSSANEAIEDETIKTTLDTVKMPLMVTICPDEIGYRATVEYDSSLYAAADMARLLQALKIFAETVALDMVTPCTKVKLVDDVQAHELEALGTGRVIDFDTTETLVSIMRRQAKAVPDSTLVVYKDRNYTYRQVDEITERIARYLVAEGVQHEQAVGVMISRSELMFIYSMAIMKAGGTYMPLDAHFPEDRLTFMCEDAQVGLVLTESSLMQESMPSFGGKVINREQLQWAFDGEERFTDIKLPVVVSTDRMVILFTSGSTGKPKGVELEQHSIVNYCHWYLREFEMTAADRALAYANYGFDAHMIDLYPTMLAGASVYIFGEDIRLDFNAMNDYIEKEHLTIGFMTTQIGCQIASIFNNNSLRLLSVGGEKMPAMAPPSYRFVNCYGPTECSLFSTTYDVKSFFEGEFIGKPLDNYQLFIVDQQLEIVPKGVPGELIVVGTAVGRGYLNRPELTAEKFITFRGLHAYRTGDLVRWSIDSRDGSEQIEFMGRIDNQVKLRGLRIELGEIENCVLAFEGIRQTCVDVKEISGSQNLVCYYTVMDGCEIDENALKTAIGEALAAFMVPEIYVHMETLPYNANGKVDRRALPIPKVALSEQENIAPETEMEKRLFDIVSELLDTDQFGITTNLISIGLTSLMAMRLSAIVKQQLDANLLTKKIMTSPTIRELVAIISESDGHSDAQQATLHAKQQYYPMTENQRGLYIDWEMNRETTQYNIPTARKIENVSPEQLREAVLKNIEAHPYLKCQFALVDNEVMIKRRDDATIKVMVQTLTEKPDADFFQQRIRPFDLFNDDLCRFEIYCYQDAVYLFQDIHHIIFDGGSGYVFMNDLHQLLAGKEIEAETYSAYDRAIDEDKLMHSECFAKAEQYFDDLVAESNAASYPHSAEPDTAEPTSRREFATIKGTAITEFCHREGLTPNSYFMTVVAAVLHRVVREQNILFASITNGRVVAEMQQIIGMFVKTLPVVLHAKTESVKDAMTAMQKQYLDTQEHAIYPYTNMVMKHNVRAEIIYVYQGGLGNSVIGDKNMGEGDTFNLNLDTVKLPISIIVGDQDEDYSIEAEYNGALYNGKDMTTLLTMIKVMAEKACLAGDAPLTSIPVVDEEEAANLISLSKGVDMPYDATKTFIDMFNCQVTSQPDSVAIVDRDSSITYGEMGRLTDYLATKLLEHDGHLGTADRPFVGIMLQRRKEFFISVVAVQKAGAAYVPMDCEYPADRLAYMLEDSRARVLVTTHNLLTDELRASLGNCHVFFIEDVIQQYASAGRVTCVNNAKPERLAYMIYTSGSTGKPKGVMISHRAMTACIAWNVPEFGLKPGKKNVNHPSFSFDASTFDLFYPLAAGAEVHVLDEELRMDMDAMAKYIHDKGITGMTTSTALGMALLNQFNLDMEYIMLGGEKFMPVKPTSTRLYNGYGPTEFTVCSSFHVIDQEKDIDIPIGKAVPNSYSFICDMYGNLLPHGVAGELCLAGIQLADGYWNREELTREKFSTIPFISKFAMPCSPIDIDRMYHTGDLARYDENGELVFMGRIDFQVKLRGFRIELGEIENAASLYEGVSATAAEVKTINGIQQLCLYFTAVHEIDQDNFREHLSQSLTEYMVPDVFIQLDEMPLTPNGKVNRRALPEPELTAMVENVPPRNGKEEILLGIATELLGHSGFGVTDNLKAQGLTSLLGIKMVAMAAKHDLIFKLDDLLKIQTIRGLLDSKMNMVFWANTPSDDKPVVVLTCGETNYKDLSPYVKALSEKFSVFVIESILEHYDVLFKDADINEVVEMYNTLIDTYIGDSRPISAFTGHCFGGEIAYRLVQRWHADHPDTKPALLMLDVFWRVSAEKLQTETEELIKILPSEFLTAHQDEIKRYSSVREMYDALNTHDEPSLYDGPMAMFRAMLPEPPSEWIQQLPNDISLQVQARHNKGRKVDNEAFWKQYYADFKCMHVMAHHMGMLGEEYVGEYVQWIIDNIQK